MYCANYKQAYPFLQYHLLNPNNSQKTCIVIFVKKSTNSVLIFLFFEKNCIIIPSIVPKITPNVPTNNNSFTKTVKHIIYYINNNNMTRFIIIISVIIALFICSKLYLKIKHPFWSTQPVFHLYNLIYWFWASDVILRNPPPINKYYDPYIDVSENVQNFIEVRDLIKTHYLRNTDMNYIPTTKSIVEYFNSHNTPCFFGTYRNFQNQLISIITGRPLFVTIYDKNFMVNYVDFLCINKDNRGKGIAPKLIYTFYVKTYSQYPICLFKREGTLNNIVPLTTYICYGFSLKYWHRHKLEHPNIKNHRIVKGNMPLLFHYMKEIKFPCMIKPSFANLSNLIEHKLIITFLLTLNDKPFACFFFRKPYTTYKKGTSIELIASFCNGDMKLFIKYFYDSLYCINVDNILIENISHNHIILNDIMSRRTPFLECKMGYFLYNYVQKPLESKDIFLLN